MAHNRGANGPTKLTILNTHLGGPMIFTPYPRHGSQQGTPSSPELTTNPLDGSNCRSLTQPWWLQSAWRLSSLCRFGDLIATRRALLGHVNLPRDLQLFTPPAPAAPRKLPDGECQADNARAANIHLFQSWWKYLKPYLNLRRGHSMDQHGTLWHFLPWQNRGHCPTRTWPTCEPTSELDPLKWGTPQKKHQTSTEWNSPLAVTWWRGEAIFSFQQLSQDAKTQNPILGNQDWNFRHYLDVPGI